MPLKDKFYQKRPVGKRKIAFLQFFSDFFRVHKSEHFICPGSSDVHKWTAGVRSLSFICRFINHQGGFVGRIASLWVEVKILTSILFLCSPLQGGCATFLDRTGCPPDFLYMSLIRVGLPEEDLSGLVKLRQGRAGGTLYAVCSASPPVLLTLITGIISVIARLRS